MIKLIRFTKRPNKFEKAEIEKLTAELTELGETSQYRADNLEDLHEIRRVAYAKSRRNEAKLEAKTEKTVETPQETIKEVKNEIPKDMSENDFNFSEFDAVLEEKVERSYSGTNDDASNPHLGKEYAEPVIKTDVQQLMEQEEQERQSQEGEGGGDGEGGEPFENPTTKGMSDKEKTDAAKNLSKTILKGYRMAHEVAASACKISESKVQKMLNEGEISIEARLPLGDEGEINLPEFAATVNVQIDEALKYTEGFDEEVEPILTRVLAKKDWGLSDETRLLLAFGQDAAPKAMMVFQIAQTQKMILKGFTQFTQQYNEMREEKAQQQAQQQQSVRPSVITRPAKKAATKRTSRAKKGSASISDAQMA
jgi:hypothetical protein